MKMPTLLLILLVATLTLCWSCTNSPIIKQEKTSFEELAGLYEMMQRDGVNTDTLLLYGYFFFSETENNLKLLAIELKQQEYKLVNLYSEDNQLYTLHVERIEQHNAKSLFDLHENLYAVAAKYEVLYDSFNIGNTDKTKPLKKAKTAWSDFFVYNDFVQDSLPYLALGQRDMYRFLNKKEFIYFITVNIPYETNNNPAQLPIITELDVLQHLEDTISSTLLTGQLKSHPNTYFVYHSTHNKIQSATWITKDSSQVKEKLTSLQQDTTIRPFDFQIVEDKTWNIYHEMLKKLNIPVPFKES